MTGDREAERNDAHGGERSPPACPICGSTSFVPGPKGRMAPNGRMPRCAKCRSLERHRMFRMMFERLGPERLPRRRDAIQFSPDPTLDPELVQELRAFRLRRGGEPRYPGDRPAETAPTGSSPARMCWSMSPTTARRFTSSCASPRPTGSSGSSCPILSARRRRATGAFRSRKSTATTASTAPTSPSGSRATCRSSRSIAYLGEDPVTGERDGCFLLPKYGSGGDGSRRGWRPDSRLFAGPSDAP